MSSPEHWHPAIALLGFSGRRWRWAVLVRRLLPDDDPPVVEPGPASAEVTQAARLRAVHRAQPLRTVDEAAGEVSFHRAAPPTLPSFASGMPSAISCPTTRCS